MASKVRWAVVGYVSAMAFVAVTILLPFITGDKHLHPDLSVMWAGLRAANPYSIAEVTALHQQFWHATPGPMAFAYPPSSLPLYFPLSLLPFWTAFWSWTALSIVFFWSAARRITKHVALVFLAPNVLSSLVFGQTALFTGGAVIWGITLLRSRPLLAGACFGLGAALKPQCFFLMPLALVSGRHWRTMIAMILTWLMLALPTFSYWPDWLNVIRVWPSIIAKHYPLLVKYGATPSYFAQAIHVPVLPLQLIGIAVGVPVAWFAFRNEDSRVRLIGLVCGTLLASPYAIKYELAPLAPALIESFMLNTVRGAIVAAPLLATGVLAAVPTLAISGVWTALISKRVVLNKLVPVERDLPGLGGCHAGNKA